MYLFTQRKKNIIYILYIYVKQYYTYTVYVCIQTDVKGDKSYIVPHDLAFYTHATDPQTYLCGTTACAGFYLRGVVLHNGQVMVIGIGGLNLPPRNLTTGQPTHFSQPIQPANTWTYMDFKEKKIKWGKNLPFARYHHCVVKYNESTAFVFGGGDNGGENGKGYILAKYRFKGPEVFIKELRSGFFMRFPDPNDPQNNVVTEVCATLFI